VLAFKSHVEITCITASFTKRGCLGLYN